MGGMVAELESHKLIANMAPQDYISVILPTRHRIEPCIKSVMTMVETAQNPGKVEFILIWDDDDLATAQTTMDKLAPKLKDAGVNRFSAHTIPRMGYERLNEYVTWGGKQSVGQWIVFWNDDAVMKTFNWDTEIRKWDGKFRILRMKEQTEHPYSIFPVVPRDWLTVLGHLSYHASSDAHISQMAYMLDIMQNIDVTTSHERYDITGDNNDEVYQTRPKLEGNPENPTDLNSDETTTVRYTECSRLWRFMKATGQTQTGWNDKWFVDVLQGKVDTWEKLKQNDPNGLTTQGGKAHTETKLKLDHGQNQKSD